MKHIFFSYSRREEAAVTAIAGELRARGIEVWQDISGKASGIPYSVSWFDAIEEAVYTASGALIFSTSAWEASAPCRKEYDLIRRTLLPYRVVELEEAPSPEQLDELARWCRAAVSDGNNAKRVWMLSGAYRILREKPYASLIPKLRGLWRSLSFLLELRACRRMAEEFDGKDVALYGAVLRFLARARRSVAGRWLGRAAAVLLFFAAVLTAFTIAYGIPYASSEINRQAEALLAYRTLEQAGKEELSAVLSAASSDSAEDSTMVRGLAAVLSRYYPSDAVSSGEEAEALCGRLTARPQGERYTVLVSEETGAASLCDAATGVARRLSLPGAPAAWCFDESEELLVLACGDGVFLVRTGVPIEPAALSGCPEEAVAVWLDGGRVLVRTASGGVVVWDVPWRLGAADEAIDGGAAGFDGAGEAVAVYAAGEELFVLRGGERTAVPVQGLKLDGRFAALSPDGSLAAVLGCREGEEADSLAVVSVPDASVRAVFEAPVSLCGAVFSADGARAAAGSLEGGLWEVGLLTGESRLSEAGDVYPYALAPYGSGYLAGTTGGELCAFDGSLSLVSRGKWASWLSVPVRQVAVSEAGGYAFSAQRGGASLTGQCRTALSDGDQKLLVPLSEQEYVSTVSVAVSQDGRLAAYGCPDGTITLWETETLNLRWVTRQLCESVTALAFSPEGDRLAVLGSTGSLFSVSIPQSVAGCAAGDAASQRAALTAEVSALAARLESFGLPG